MSEEGQFTYSVPEYLEKSRFPILSRYRDLMAFVKGAFSDGHISDLELHQIERAESDILLEYQVAADVFFKMDPGSKGYAAAERLLYHLHRCNVFMRFARDQARLKHAREKMGPDHPTRDRRKEDLAAKEEKVILIESAAAGFGLMKSLETPYERIQAELPTIRRNLAKLSPEERIELEAKINAMLDQLRDRQLEHLSIEELNRIIGLEKYLMGEREHVRES